MFVPPHEPIANGTLLTMTSATPGATIRYTLDGTDPNLSSPVYSAQITINSTHTVSAQAYRTGFSNSPVRKVFFSGAAIMEPIEVVNGLAFISWFSDPGFMYQLQKSGDLQSWSDQGSPQAGTGGLLYFILCRPTCTRSSFGSGPIDGGYSPARCAGEIIDSRNSIEFAASPDFR